MPLVIHDLHCHSRVSSCATPECTVERLVTRAADAGLALLGLTDHIHGNEPTRLEEIYALAAHVRSQAWPVRVWVGAELSLLGPGRMPVAPHQVAGLDYVLVSPNHVGVPHVEGPHDWTPESVAHWLLDHLAAAIDERPLAVSHPFDHGFELRVPAAAVFAAFDRERIRALLVWAAKRRVAIELNARKVRRAPAFYQELIGLARDTGARFTLGSDSHSPDEMAYGGADGREQYEELLRRIGLTPALVWDETWWKSGPES
jgi:histidinol phosphatase-like PHP family hydrolase